MRYPIINKTWCISHSAFVQNVKLIYHTSHTYTSDFVWRSHIKLQNFSVTAKCANCQLPQFHGIVLQACIISEILYNNIKWIAMRCAKYKINRTRSIHIKKKTCAIKQKPSNFLHNTKKKKNRVYRAKIIIYIIWLTL